MEGLTWQSQWSRDVQFSFDELNLLREWFDSMSDTNPKYVEDRDRALYAKICGVIADCKANWDHANGGGVNT